MLEDNNVNSQDGRNILYKQTLSCVTHSLQS